MSLLSTLQGLNASGALRSQATVDVSFEVGAAQLPEHYRFALADAVFRALPWMAREPLAGIHPVRAPLTEGGYVLSRRARLQLRVPAAAAEAATALSGAELDLGGVPLTVGAATLRPVTPFPTLRAALVVSRFADEQAFVDEVGMQLEVLEVKAEMMCGRVSTLRDLAGAGDRQVSGFSVVLHGLSIEHSLRLQSLGLGASRSLGCGLFVHHKIIDGLDAYPE